jgi:helicase
MAADFPLYERARSAGVFDDASALIVAPTATGKSYIGRDALRARFQRGVPGTHSYLVPFRALAEEVFERIRTLFEPDGARVRIATGDHRDPVRPDATDVLVATYESFSGLLRSEEFQPGFVVADELHLVADETRGAAAEALLARLLAPGRIAGFLGLSAVVENGREIADWLGIALIEGRPEDRVVPVEQLVLFTPDTDAALREHASCCLRGKQAIVFCASRRGAEAVAKRLADVVKTGLPSEAIERLSVSAGEILADDPEAESVVDLMPSGVAYHHAGLLRPIRSRIEASFRDGSLRLIACTPTLSAGVNLPAEVVIVRDAFRTEVVRGRAVPVLLPSAELLNMLGRAGRPGQADKGRGVVLFDARHEKDPDVASLSAAVRSGRGTHVESRLPSSFESLLRFVLAVVVERREASLGDLAEVYKRTLAYRSNPEEIRFDRSFREDMMEDISAYQRVEAARGAIRLGTCRITSDGIRAEVQSKDKTYEVILGVHGTTCSCPAASRWYRGEICKHVACAVHDLLFTRGDDSELRERAVYTCVHLFGKTLDAGTRLVQAVDLLERWALIERTAGGWRAAPVGGVAIAMTRGDLLLVHSVMQRANTTTRATYRDVVEGAVIDFFPEDVEQRWLEALRAWLDEVPENKFRLPVKHRGDFESGVEDVAGVCRLVEATAEALGKDQLAKAAREAAGAVRYGVKPELVPLMALRFRQLGRARCRHLHDRHGIRSLADLASANPAQIADVRRAPLGLTKSWVERAREIHNARATAAADRDLADAEFDEIVARFRIDPEAIVPSPAAA